MENASRALLMAAGVLIGILIISLAVYLFTNFGRTSREINKQNAEKQLTDFNARFTSLEEKDLTIYDVVTTAGFANENNEYYENNPEYTITVVFGTYKNAKNIFEDKTNLFENYKNVNTIKVKDIKYNSNGRVNYIEFK